LAAKVIFFIFQLDSPVVYAPKLLIDYIFSVSFLANPLRNPCCAKGWILPLLDLTQQRLFFPKKSKIDD